MNEPVQWRQVPKMDPPKPAAIPRRQRLASCWWQWLMVVLVSLGLLAFYAFRSTAEPPSYYVQLVPQKMEDVIRNVRTFDEKVTSLNDQLAKSQDGENLQISFSQDEINSWLMQSLPRRFPAQMPRELQEIRIKLQPDAASIVMKVNTAFFHGFVTADLDVSIGAKPNQLQVTLKRVYSGLATLPFARFRKQILEGAQKAGLEVDWPEGQTPTVISIELAELLSQQVSHSVEIKEVRIGQKTMSIDYQFSESAEPLAAALTR